MFSISISFTDVLFLGLRLGMGCPMLVGLFGSIFGLGVGPATVLAGIGRNCTCFFGGVTVVVGAAVVLTTLVVVGRVVCADVNAFSNFF